MNRSVSHAHRTVGAKPGSGFFSKRVYRHHSSFRYSFKICFSAAGRADRRGGYQRLDSLVRLCCVSCQPTFLSSQGKPSLAANSLLKRIRVASSRGVPPTPLPSPFFLSLPCLAHPNRRPLFTTLGRASILCRARRPTLKKRFVHKL